MYDLNELKNKILNIDAESSVFYLSNGLGDKVMYLSQLDNYRKLMGCNVTIVSRGGQYQELVNFFPSLNDRFMPLDTIFYDYYNEEQILSVLHDGLPGVNKIFRAVYAAHSNLELTKQWLAANSKELNQYNLAKYHLNLPASAIPEFVNLTTLKKASLNKHKYMVLAPVANSTNRPIEINFWVQLAENLIQDGYSCFVNAVSGSQNKFEWARFEKIGCQLFNGSLTELVQLCQSAAHTFTIRSGLADLLSLTKEIKYSVIYPPDHLHLKNFLTLDHGFGSSPTAEISFEEKNFGNYSSLISKALSL
jgi:hypothetical protein